MNKFNDIVEVTVLYAAATVAAGPLKIYDKMMSRRQARKHANRQYMTTEDFVTKYFPNR